MEIEQHQTLKPDLLLAEAENLSTLGFHSFSTLTKSEETLYCFYENKDDCYYHLRIKLLYDSPFVVIRCGNKQGVLSTHAQISSKVSTRYKTAYFVDSDYEDTCVLSGVYSTPCYSIENLYSDPEVIGDFLNNELKLDSESGDLNKVMDLFIAIQSTLIQHLPFLDAFYILQQRLHKNIGKKVEFSFYNKIIPNLFDFTLDGIITHSFSLERFKADLTPHQPFEESDLLSIYEEIISTDPLKRSRGKYLYEFACKFLNKVISDSSVFLSKRVKYHIDFSSALTLMSIYAVTPKCLKDYLLTFK